MRIAYSGWFLREGFERLGCEVAPIRLDSGRTLDEIVEEAGVKPDVVFLEFYGRTEIPKGLGESRHRLAAWCIDAPLGAFWLAPLCKLFALVYVDQLFSVSRFRSEGVQARWLPLCVSEGDFRPPAAKEHLITFVGRLTEHREKRANLIAHLQARFPLNVVSDIPQAAMLDLFAASRMVLNENFFPGLNLRFLHALASGSLLLSERQGYGVRQHFQEGTHYLGYSPADVAGLVERVAQDAEGHAHIARNGQEECRLRHTSACRARTVLDHLAEGRAAPMVSLPERLLGEGRGRYAQAVRHGGRIDEALQLLHDAAAAPGGVRPRALHALGLILLRTGREEAGLACLEEAAGEPSETGLDATLTLLLHLARGAGDARRLASLASRLEAARLDKGVCARHLAALAAGRDVRYHVCMLGYAALFKRKDVCDLGFQKPYEERYPDSALEYAAMAYATLKTPEALDAVIACTRAAGVATQALGWIKDAVLSGVATDAQIALSIELALASYDYAYAARAVKAFKRTFS
ncbi:hypothetical protein NNJEOMEG_00864 [Fundidesulfovibrio magnetotacticus]|uniref:Spore protein YkvP/CgeB glycosyl transferase-like domain-containing protein n=1 Tax=Fundidesulfovibrio magnetotacticus TaxID=2730080 RepID=A0A6V8LXN2_9BACT|nr:glycosyltransferase [Fundidesulfovibrio magnetotacticus]GFK93035.1 hypothetical protein NNJEOMEG_00864 [Fundidesulfovibrio magnetotacticus]